MRNKKFKKGMAGLCAALLVAGTVGMAVQASGTTDLDDTTPGGNTSVIAKVDTSDDPYAPTYIIAIPQKVDFGNLRQPVTDTNAYKTTDITVKCTQAVNIPTGSTIAVLVKDSTASVETDPFVLIKDDGNSVKLNYEMLVGGESIQNQTWYNNGFLFNSFTQAGQEATNTLRINQRQLYGKDLSTYGGTYTGTLKFYTRLASIGDIQ